MGRKDKNDQQTEAKPKKDYTSVLESIRKRTGLLVGIVGLALLIFILESLLGSGASIFGGDEVSSVGYINGHKIDRNEFVMKLENQMNNYRQRNQGKEVDDNIKGQAIESIWQQYVVEHAIKPQFEKIGIRVGEDELYEKVVVHPAESIIESLSDPNTGKLNEQFARADGSLDLVKWKQAVQSVVGDQEMAVRQMEDVVKSTIYFKKFRALLKGGIYATKAEAKAAYNSQMCKYDLSFVLKPFDSVADSTVKISDADIKKYYNDHSWEFLNTETTRKVEYVSFNVNPSPDDLNALEKDAARIAEEFKGKTPGEDSALMAQESEDGMINIQNFTKKNMIVRDSNIFTSQVGTVFGPYNEGAYFKIYKLEGINLVADSARVRHILVSLSDPKTNQQKRSKADAKREADSLLVLLNEKKVVFDSLVRNFSDDPGSKTNGGDYGWFDENEQFVEPFKNAGLMGTKGTTSVVETQFGYHIIEVLDVSPAKHTSYKVAQISKLIGPSDETNQKVFARANQFSGENNNEELFNKAVEAQKLSKRLADNIKEGDRQLPGLEGARELVRWVYTAKKGEVALFSFPDKHVVAMLSGIRSKGTLPLEEVKDEVITKVRKEKKAEMFIAEFNTKAGNAKSIQDAATSLGLRAINQDHLIMENPHFDTAGQDYIMGGTLEGIKPGTLTKPIASNSGVFRMALNKVTTEPDPANWKEQQARVEQLTTGRSDYQSFNAIKELADIQDHKSKID